MNEAQIVAGIKEKFPHHPTSDQEKALQLLAHFLLSTSQQSLFLLRGYAGTGKSSLIAALVKMMTELKQPTVLLAPTGRAAKQLALYAQHPAFTIHKRIYRQKTMDGLSGSFSLNYNSLKHGLFLIDEASMIANDSMGVSNFGTGRLLDDLFQFVYSSEGCRILLMGDTAQLPPVGQELSPALMPDHLRAMGVELFEIELTQVVRQAENSGILWNATQLRRCISDSLTDALPRVRLTGFPDVVRLPGDELIEALGESYNQVGADETIVITRSNKRAALYNKGIRATIFDFEEELDGGDRLMIAKNNYYWTEDIPELEFLANGDQAVVRRVRKTRGLYGFRFADVVLSFPDYEDIEIEVTLLLNTLQSESPSLTREESELFFKEIYTDYQELATKKERMNALKKDTYFNALQAKYGYAVTCHKAQGGQWKRVFLDQSYIPPEQLTADYFRWLYTAFTRATEKLYLVNYPETQID
ncbi:MAG: AAA family ATPase [Bacteroidaceae bacterium]